MAELTAKERIIKEVYEDKEQGYGSIKDTFKQAVKKDPSIKLDDVKKYLDKQEFRQTQFTYKKFNSYISPGPMFEFEVDLIDFTKKAKENDGFRFEVGRDVEWKWGGGGGWSRYNDIDKRCDQSLDIRDTIQKD